VAIDRLDARAALAAVAERGELAGGLHQRRVQRLGMQRVALRQVREPRVVAVGDLQHHEVADLADALLLRLVQPGGQRVGAMPHQVARLDQVVLQAREAAAVDRRRDEALVQHQLAGAAALDDARHRDAAEARARILVQHQAQVQLAQLHVGRIADALHVVLDAQVLADEARERRRGTGVDRELRHARAHQRQRQVHHGVLDLGSDLERQRRGVFLGDGERRAVRHHAARRLDRQPADLERLFLEPQAAQAPARREHARRAGFDEHLDGAFELLEMLRPQEQSLRPDDALSAHALVVVRTGADDERGFMLTTRNVAGPQQMYTQSPGSPRV